MDFSFEKELKKCFYDFTYFAENYIKIKHPTKGLISFNLYPYQSRLIKEYNDNRFSIVKKFRQSGATTTTLAWLLWECMFKLDHNILFISRTDHEAIHCCSLFNQMIKNLPEWLMPTTSKNNSHEKEFTETNSRINFWSPAAARSKAATILVIDEPAFITNMEEHWKAMYPCISCGAKVIAISTPNGRGNWFEKTYTEAEQDKNLFTIVNLNYKEHPDYQNPEFCKMVMENLGADGWSQEVLASFD